MSLEGEQSSAWTIADECVAVRLRSLNRSLGVIYDDALRPLGLRIGQLNILVAVACMGRAKPADICRVLQMEKSTLSRDVKVMQRRGWLSAEPGEDRRVKPLRVSPEGAELIERCLPAWRAAQAEAVSRLGDEGVAMLRRTASIPGGRSA